MGAAVNGYLQIDAYSIALTGATFAYGALLISLGKTRVLVPATIILVASDVVLNYVFIFGNFGYPALGMRGAAVGSVGAELLTAKEVAPKVPFWMVPPLVLTAPML